jgi:MFS family permease
MKQTPIGRSQWKVLTLLGAGTVFSLLGDNTLYTVLPNQNISREAGVSLAMVGVILGVNRIVRLGLNPIAGALYDRLPRRALLVGSLFIGTLSTALYALSQGPSLLLVGRVLWGVAWAGIWIGGNTAVLDIADDSNRGRMSGFFQMWFFAGIGIAAFLGGTFTGTFGYRSGLWISTAITGSAAVLWLFFLPETRPHHVINERPSTPEAINLPLIVTAAVPVFAVRLVFAGVIASTTILWLGSFLDENVSFAGIMLPIVTVTGGFAAVRSLTSVLGAPLAGQISDKLGMRWPVIAISLVLGAIGMWLMGGNVLLLALVGAMVAAVSSGGVQAMAQSITGDRVALSRHSRGLGVIYSLGDLGSAIGPPLALGLLPIFQVGGVYRMSAILLMVVTLFSLLQMRNEQKRR